MCLGRSDRSRMSRTAASFSLNDELPATTISPLVKMAPLCPSKNPCQASVGGVERKGTRTHERNTRVVEKNALMGAVFTMEHPFA